MVHTGTIRTIVGIIGNVISFGLFVSPIPTFVKIWKAKSVQEFKADPYIATVLNCAMWSFYGLPFVHPDSLLVVTINGAGLVIELIYVAIFFAFSPWEKRRKIIICLLIEAAFMVGVIVVTLECFHHSKSRSMIVGVLCIIFTILMYASPLTVMKKVIKMKSVKYMPFCLSLATFANGIVWMIYAILKFDHYILVPNILGTISGLVQLILYAIYYKTQLKLEGSHEEKPTSQIQLSNV
ncbi:hypothetical protein UlMin_008009 [Ulmus minor]